MVAGKKQAQEFTNDKKLFMITTVLSQIFCSLSFHVFENYLSDHLSETTVGSLLSWSCSTSHLFEQKIIALCHYKEPEILGI